VDLTPGQRGSVEPPPASASYAEKMAYYRAQHTTTGVRATHLVGVPGAAISIPLLLAKPRVGLALFAASWALQVAGHLVFEKNRPALAKGPLSYQLCGLAFWCEEVVDLVAGRGLGGSDRPIVTIPESATTAS
jgi:hypothetical protein